MPLTYHFSIEKVFSPLRGAVDFQVEEKPRFQMEAVSLMGGSPQKETKKHSPRFPESVLFMRKI